MRTTSATTVRVGLSALVAVLGAAATVLLYAASPVFWRVATQDDFLRGRVENLTIDAAGQVRLGPASAVVFETTAPFLWTAALADRTLWVGSGNDGKVFVVDSDGAGTEVFDAAELNVHAVTPSGDETAFVATSPHGKVYEVGSDGDPPVVFDPEEPYIWAMVQPAGTRDLYVATGEPGRIYRVTPDGTATLFYDTQTAHVLTLAFDSVGNLWAGTGSPGRVFRISPAGRGFVVLDSSFEEVRAIRLAPEGRAYAVAVSQSPGRSTGGSTGTAATPPSVSTSGSSTATVTTSVTVSATTVSSSPGRQVTAGSTSGAVYRIEPDGVWDTVWKSSTDTPYDVALDDHDGETGLLVATGGAGKIFRVLEDPYRVELVTSAPAKQVTRIVSAGDGSHYFLTANPGKVFRLSSSRVASGLYVSDVRDATTVATWGTVRWQAITPSGTAVRLSTRSGNTDQPNDTWSAWSEPYDDAAGSAISSPKARYIQWRAALTGQDATPSLLTVTTAYLPRNLRPEITQVTVHPPGVVFQQPFSGTDPPIAGLGVRADTRPARANDDTQQSSLGRRVYRKGLQTFVWSASDANTDTLEYTVQYRAASDTTWRTLIVDSRAAIFTWNTTTTPDGTYVVRVLATDGPSNAPGAAEIGFADSTPFDIDNTAPDIAVAAARPTGQQVVVPFVVEDAHSPVQRVEYSLDTDHWQVLYPLDGIPDSQVERFEVTVPNDRLDRLVIRATDNLGNTATVAGS
jgi:hypothetical protein